MRRQIGVTAQDATLDEVLTGRQNLVMVGGLSGLRAADAKARATELLAQVDLIDAADRIVREYSGGMRRRLDLAAGLVTRPPVLFLDEPTTGLDPTSRVRMWGVIRDLVADGATLLLTTQYLDEADELADRIVVVDHGRVIADGTSAELKVQTGGARLEVTLSGRQPDGPSRHSSASSRAPSTSATTGAASAHPCAASPGWRRRSSGPWTAPESPWTTSRCTSRRSTTCSSPSPAIRPRNSIPTERRRRPHEPPSPYDRPCHGSRAGSATSPS